MKTPTLSQALTQARGIVRLAERLEESADAAVGPVGHLAATDLLLDAEALVRRLQDVLEVVADVGAEP